MNYIFLTNMVPEHFSLHTTEEITLEDREDLIQNFGPTSTVAALLTGRSVDLS